MATDVGSGLARVKGSADMGHSLPNASGPTNGCDLPLGVDKQETSTALGRLAVSHRALSSERVSQVSDMGCLLRGTACPAAMCACKTDVKRSSTARREGLLPLQPIPRKSESPGTNPVSLIPALQSGSAGSVFEGESEAVGWQERSLVCGRGLCPGCPDWNRQDVLQRSTLFRDDKS